MASRINPQNVQLQYSNPQNVSPPPAIKEKKRKKKLKDTTMAATTRRFDQNQSTKQKDLSIIRQKHKLKLNTNMEGEETRKISLIYQIH